MYIWKEKFQFLCMLLIMYGIIQVYRLDVRLATGPGGLKPIWILVPVMVRAVTEGYRFSGYYRLVSEHRASRVRKDAQGIEISHIGKRCCLV